MDTNTKEWLLAQVEDGVRELAHHAADDLDILLARFGYVKDAWWEREGGKAPCRLCGTIHPKANMAPRHCHEARRVDATEPVNLADEYVKRERSKAACDAHTALWEALDGFSGRIRP